MDGVLNGIDLSTMISAFLGSLGGGGVVVKIFADRYLEKMKMELRKSEFLFQKEFEAASRFISLHYRFIPSSQHPLDPSDDCVRDFASKLGAVEKELEQYRQSHGAALQQEVLKRLAETIEKAGLGKYAADDSQSEQPGVLNYNYRLNLSGQVMKELEAIKDDLWKEVRSQVGA